MNDVKLCTHCGSKLESEREQFILCCYECRRYALLYGIWPEEAPFFQKAPTELPH